MSGQPVRHRRANGLQLAAVRLAGAGQGNGSGMDAEERVPDVAIQSVLRQTERTLRRSREVLLSADAAIGQTQDQLHPIDEALATAPIQLAD